MVEPVEGTEQVVAVRFGHVQVYQRGFDAFMTQELLDTDDVHTKLEQVSGIAVPEGM